MALNITQLPGEVLNTIHQTVMDMAKAGAGPVHTQSVCPPLTPAQQARRAFVARDNLSRTCKRLHLIDKGNLRLKENAETGCLVTENIIRNLAASDKQNFIQRVRSLLQDNQNVGVDFSSLSEEQTDIALDLLVERAKSGKPLHHLRFNADMDRVSPEMLCKINDAIPIISKAAGEDTVIEFACSSHDENRTAAPDLSRLTNLTEVDFSRCNSLNTTPDFSNNLKLKSVNLSRCEGLTIRPDFSNNPELEWIDLSRCRELSGTLDFLKNPKLKFIDASNCRELVINPNFSNNPDLESVILNGAARFMNKPDFSKNPKLKLVNLGGCTGLGGQIDFSKNQVLKWVNLHWCLELSDELDFSNNPKLEFVDFRYCLALKIAPVFSKNHLPRRVCSTMNDFSMETQNELRELLGNRLTIDLPS